MKGIGALLWELRRRRVFRVAGLYVVGAWLIVQVADIFLPAMGIPQEAMRSLLIALLLGFPVAVVLGWMFQITPAGLVRTETFSHTAGDKSLTLHRVDYVLLSALLLILATIVIGLVTQVTKIPAEAEPASLAAAIPLNSIAVLPATEPGSDARHDYFSDGVSEELLNSLARLSGLQVSARDSSFRFKGKGETSRNIGEQLGVKSLLEISVSMGDEQVQITAQLINAENGYQIWSNTYDGRLTTEDLFAIQNDVATKITGALKASVSARERERLAAVPTQNLKAYQVYLLGRQEMARRTVASLEAAIEHFEEAKLLDREFALAYVGIADSYSILLDWGHVSKSHVISLIRDNINRALELDDSLGEAYVSLAALHEYDRTHRAAELAYKRGIELSPNYAIGYHWYSLFLQCCTGRWEEALEAGQTALILDPLSPLYRLNVAASLAALGRFDAAMGEFSKSREVDPTFGYTYRSIAEMHASVYGQMRDALIWYNKAITVEPDPDWVAHAGSVYLMLGDETSAGELNRKARGMAPDNILVRWHSALLDAYRGDRQSAAEHALAYLDGPIDRYMGPMLFILRNADLEEGRYEEARRRYAESHFALAGEDPAVHRSNVRAAIDLSLILLRMGQPAQASWLLEESRSVITTMTRLGVDGYGLADAEIAALQGKTDEALRALRAAVADGWRYHWYLWTERNPNLDSIRNEPEYSQIIDQLRAEMAHQLEQVKQDKLLVASLPYSFRR